MLYKEWDMDRALEIQKQEGIEEGMEKGMEKGMVEAQSKLVLAMAQKLNPEKIANFTGMELAQIKEILRAAEN